MSKAKKAPGTDQRARLRTVEVLKGLSEEYLEQVTAAGEVTEFGPGEMLFQAGDPSDRMHVVLAGAIEILRASADHPEPVPVAYLTPGEALGDMALLTGAKRRSGARVPERAKVWTLTREAFEEVACEIPGYAMQLARMFALRLEEFITHMRGQQSRRKELSGRLKYFDMPTVVQTLVSSNQTGLLSLTDAAGETFADVMIVDGQLERARCRHIEGEEAFYELFLGPDNGQFHFRSVSEPDPDSVSRVPLAQPAMNLLMEAMRRVDELPEMQQRLPEPDKTVQAKRKPRRLKWNEPATREVAKEMLTRLSTPGRVADLVGEIPCSTYTLYGVAARLYETRQIA